jgi:hypothetical protein
MDWVSPRVQFLKGGEYLTCLAHKLKGKKKKKTLDS